MIVLVEFIHRFLITIGVLTVVIRIYDWWHAINKSA